MKIRCKDCKQIGRSESQRHSLGRKHYYCTNPKVYELKDKRGYQINNFIGYGDSTIESSLQLKLSKNWCPIKEVKK